MTKHPEYPLLEANRWRRADNYAGETFEDYYVIVGRSRDSNILEEANFEAALERLGGEDDVNVVIARASHWAVGWVESLLVSDTAPDEILEEAEQILEDLQAYPILDEEIYVEKEEEKMREDAVTYSNDIYEALNIDTDKVVELGLDKVGDFGKFIEMLPAIIIGDLYYYYREDYPLDEDIIRGRLDGAVENMGWEEELKRLYRLAPLIALDESEYTNEEVESAKEYYEHILAEERGQERLFE